MSENKVTVMESEGDNEKFKLSREEGFMIEYTDNIKRDICDARKKEIVLFYYIFIYWIFLGRYGLELHWASSLSLSFRLTSKWNN